MKPAWYEYLGWFLIGTEVLKQPEDRVETWSPAFISKLLEYHLAFQFLGQETIKTEDLPANNKQGEKRPKVAENGMVSIDDIIPI